MFSKGWKSISGHYRVEGGLGNRWVEIWSYCSALAGSFCLPDQLQSLAPSVLAGTFGGGLVLKRWLWSQPLLAQTPHRARADNAVGQHWVQGRGALKTAYV